MLKHLKVEGFKSIRLATVELGAVNVFIGANGSGKSNFLEAFGLCGAALFGSVEAETLKQRGVRPGLTELYKTSLAVARVRCHLCRSRSVYRAHGTLNSRPAPYTGRVSGWSWPARSGLEREGP
ncbi:MAG: AAA family ATPase [Planctomycetota bacterium]|nr:AAA family ATPase [Planctomycetota bacterium]